MSCFSRRSLLLAVGASGVAMMASTGAAVADEESYYTDAGLTAGQSVDHHQAPTLGPNQTATSKFTVNFRSLDAPLYANTYVRCTGTDRYSASLVNREDRLRLRLHKLVDNQTTALGEVASIPLADLPDSEEEWTVVLGVEGNRLTASAESGSTSLIASADDSAINDGAYIVQNFYLSRTGSTATVKRACLDQASSSERTDVVRDETFSTLVFEDTFDAGSDFAEGKWAEYVDGISPYHHLDATSCLDHDWGVVDVEAHDVADGCGRLWWRLRRNEDGSLNPETGWQNTIDTANGETTLRYYDEAYVTTEDTDGEGSLQNFVYGRLESRIRFSQEIEGLWGGLRLQPDDRSNGGEIDVAEAYGGGDATGIVGATVHFSQTDDPSTRKPQDILPRPDLTEFHTYAVEKTPSRITFYVDDARFHEVLREDGEELFDSCFGPDSPYHVCLSTRVGCMSWDDAPDPSVFEQASMDVDYVRVWAMD